MNLVNEYKCLNCKAGLEFEPQKLKWVCAYCFSEFDKEQLDRVYQEEELNDDSIPELDSYHCTSCGAELIADITTSATRCLYCSSPTIIKSRFSGRFKPQSLIPFRLTKSQAEDIYRNWIKKRIFAPDEFKSQEEIEKITGIYAPYWLFDCMVDGNIEGEATQVHSWTQGDYRYTQTKYYRIVRTGKVRYQRVPIDASKKLDDNLMQLIEPFNYDELTDFSMKYISGFMAERFDLETDEAEILMKKRVDEYTEERLRDTVLGYATFTVQQKQIILSDLAHDYSLLPVYILVNKYKDKEYIFMVNGQTGKIVGNAPFSLSKQLLFAGAVFASVWFLAVFGGALFG